MKDYININININPDLIIINAGTNDLKFEKTEKEIAVNVLNLAKKVKTTNNEVIISSMIFRNDKLNSKGQQVNSYLKTLCSQNSIDFIDNNLIIITCSSHRAQIQLRA